ncbi:MAG: nucleoside triphosphate pyrophosphohydrolase [Leptolyngbyaceae cyanobacterium bins.302]|nr:nucleoside triphosphate pyrophosphohydrolase [Leptolyngbyaceae cyanobacterium bins.302]
MRKTQNKLIRDRIPEIIQSAGQEYSVEVMAETEFQQALRKKLIEEAQEAAADSENLVQELADLYEVIDTLMATQQISREAVLIEQERRHSERGGFTKRLKLIWSGAN